MEKDSFLLFLANMGLGCIMIICSIFLPYINLGPGLHEEFIKAENGTYGITAGGSLTDFIKVFLDPNANLFIYSHNNLIKYNIDPITFLFTNRIGNYLCCLS